MNLPAHTPTHPRMEEASHGNSRGPGGPDGWNSNSDHGGDHDQPRLATAKAGLWLFLVTATVVFSMLLSAYVERKTGTDWSILPRLGILWLNTGFLVLSSAAMEWARRLARRGDLQGTRFWWLLGGAFAVLFLLGQLLAWQALYIAGYGLSSNPSSSFFYLLTTLHGLHLLAGLIAWGWATVSIVRLPETALAKSGIKIELCALFWHFLLLVWLAIFGFIWFVS